MSAHKKIMTLLGLVMLLLGGCSGETVDYLVVSNTQNLQDYPVSLYGYTQFQLTRIAGWND